MRAAPPAAKDAEYKRADANFYWKGDVLKVDPNAVIVPLAQVTQKGDVYSFKPKAKAPKEIYVQVVNDWIEPITPPDMPASLGVAPDAMEIREPQGDVKVAFPNAPATFLPATAGMTIPNDAEVKTGANSSAAILIGGVESARLIPNSDVSISQVVTPEARTTRVILTKGAVFSKVGQQVGVKEDYTVKTPFGVAAARGTDFVTLALPARTDVWIAQGTVELNQPDGKTAGTVTSDGTGALKIVRYPAMPDARQTMMASAETMTAAMNFIPLANIKIKGLRDKMSQGVKLTASEQDYIGRIKQVPCLIKLVLVPQVVVAPPPPPPVVVKAPMPAPPVVVKTPAPAPPAVVSGPAPAPAPGAPPAAGATPPSLGTPGPIDLYLREDGKVDFKGDTLTFDQLKVNLTAIGKFAPTQAIVIKGGDKAPAGQVKKVLEMAKAAKLKKVTVDKATAPAATPPAPTMPTEALPGTTNTISAPAKPTPSPVAPAKPAPPVVASTPAPVAPAPGSPAPLDILARADGKVELLGSILTLDELKTKLDSIAKATPNLPIVVKKKEKLEKGTIRKVVDVCRAASFLQVTVDKTPPPASSPVATGPAPTVKPATAPASVKPTPAAPAPLPAPAKPALPPAMLIPMNLQLRPDGKIDFQGATVTLNDLKLQLEEIALVAPKQPLVISGKGQAPKGQLKKVLALCKAAKLREVTVAKAEPRATLVASNGIASAPEMSATNEAMPASVSPLGGAASVPATAESESAAKPKTTVASTHSPAVHLTPGEDAVTVP